MSDLAFFLSGFIVAFFLIGMSRASVVTKNEECAVDLAVTKAKLEICEENMNNTCATEINYVEK